MESVAEFIVTSKGRPCLLLDGYQHRVIRKNAEKTSWLCLKSERKKCKGMVKTDPQNVVLSKTEHSCVPNLAEIEVKKTMEKCKKRVMEEPSVPVHKIFREEMANIRGKGFDLEAATPVYSSAKSSLCHVRRKMLGKVKNPQSSTEILSRSKGSDRKSHEFPDVQNPHANAKDESQIQDNQNEVNLNQTNPSQDDQNQENFTAIVPSNQSSIVAYSNPSSNDSHQPKKIQLKKEATCSDSQPNPPKQSSKTDEFDVFGEYVACELRSIKSDFLRNKLKRGIQRLVLDILDEDDVMSGMPALTNGITYVGYSEHV